MQSSKTVTFTAEALHPGLDVLFLRLLQSTTEQPALCRLTVDKDAVQFATAFRKGTAGFKVSAAAEEPFEFAILAARVAALRYVDGNLTFTVDDKRFCYETSSGVSGSGSTYCSALVPEIELPPLLGIESAASLSAILDLCAPFGGESITCHGSVVTVGDPQRSMTLEFDSLAGDWVVPRDASPAVSDYLQLVGGDVQLLGNHAKFGLTNERTWFVWPRSVKPEVRPLTPAKGVGGQLTFETTAISNAVAVAVAEVGEDNWFDLFFEEGGAMLSWTSGGESLKTGVVPYDGLAPHHHVRVHGSDLGVLFRRARRNRLGLVIDTRGEAVTLTTSETTKVGGQPATVRRSVVGLIPSGCATLGG